MATSFMPGALVMMQAQWCGGHGDSHVEQLWVLLAVQIPLAYYLAHTAGLGPNGVFWTVAIAQALAAVVGVLSFSRGWWKSRNL